MPRDDLLLIPGLLCDQALWQAQVSALAPRTTPMVADISKADTMSAMAADILATAPARFALVGLSLGGYVAFEILRQAPQRVSRLALMDTAAAEDDEARQKRRRGLIELAQKGRFKGVTPRLLPLLLAPAAQENPAITEVIFAMAARIGRDGFIRQQQAILSRPDSRPLLAAIDCPCLVAVGRQDALTPLATSQEMAARIPSAKLHIFDDCGHLPPLEKSDETTAVLADWLEW
jgi:pimeloyl-ACP methyl ester carboxylesterase